MTGEAKLDREVFKRIWKDFEILFDKPLSKQKADVLWKEFKFWDTKTFLEISEEVKRKTKFMPTIADFYENNQQLKTKYNEL